MRLWVGVDAEWRAVIFPKGKEAKDKDQDKKEKHSNVQHGAATLQVCTVDLSLSFHFLSLSRSLSSFFHLSFLSHSSPISLPYPPFPLPSLSLSLPSLLLLFYSPLVH